VSQAVRHYAYKPGDPISLYDEWLGRWTEVTVVTASRTLITAVSGQYTYCDVPRSPRYVRPIHIVHVSAPVLEAA
jgi:hypothetical protein